MTERDAVRWGAAKRFEFIEWRIYWTGRVNRQDIVEYFSVSTPQASVDLRDYQESNPDNIYYDSTEKAYRAKANFKPAFLILSADRYLLQLDAILNSAIQVADTWFGSPPPATVIQNIVRTVPPATLQAILHAIRRREQIKIVYQSLTNTRARVIAPHAIAYDGRRWHARAWCESRQEFRDFVITRIQSIDAATPSEINPSDDVVWNTLVEINISAHPKLSVAQRSAIEHDYGIRNGELKLKSRLAMAFYIVRKFNLDLGDDQIPPERKQIHITNLAAIEQAREEALAETRRCVSRRKEAEPRQSLA